MEEKLTKAQAMEIINSYGINITKQGLYNWINKYELGKKIVGRYYIDRQKLIDFLENKDEVKYGAKKKDNN